MDGPGAGRVVEKETVQVTDSSIVIETRMVDWALTVMAYHQSLKNG